MLASQMLRATKAGNKILPVSGMKQPTEELLPLSSV
jgi:hypothetical protein